MPANRLGQLLAEARLKRGADLEEFAHRSEFTVGELGDLEAGHRVLNESLIKRVTALYEIDCGPIVPHRSELTIDMTDKTMSAAGKAVRLESAAHEHVLERYLSLVYLLRNHTPGSTVPLRDEDVAILAASLAEREELIEEQLLFAMSEDRESVNGLVDWFRKRLWVPTAGALVGVVSIGTLVMVSSDAGSATTPTTEPEPEPDTGSPAQAAALIIPRSTAITSSTALSSSTTQASSTSSLVTNITGGGTSGASQAPTRPQPTVQQGSIVIPVTTTAAARTPASVGASAEALLPFDWEQALPGWTIVYKGPDSGFRGLTYPYDKTIEMFVRDDDSPQMLAGILAHEIGHALDVTHFGDRQRKDWRNARELGDVPWWPDAYASDFESGAGDFAEAFAYWATGDPSSSQIAGTPTAAQVATLERLVADLF